MCTHTAVCVSSYPYLHVFILLYVCAYQCICPHTILSVRIQADAALRGPRPETVPRMPHFIIYVSSHSIIYVSSYYLSAYRPMQRFAVPAPRQCHACLILSYMFPHTPLYMCPHTICPHTGGYSASGRAPRQCHACLSFCYMCPHTLLYMCPDMHTCLQATGLNYTASALVLLYMCVLILLYVCPHTPIYMCAHTRTYVYMCVCRLGG